MSCMCLCLESCRVKLGLLITHSIVKREFAKLRTDSSIQFLDRSERPISEDEN